MTLTTDSAHTYDYFPVLRKSENNTLLLVTWVSDFFTDHDLQLGVFYQWLRSRDGHILYQRLVNNIQQPCEVEQLALTMAVMINYWRSVPDAWDEDDQPIFGSYLAEFDYHIRCQARNNNGVVVKRMVNALLRVLRAYGGSHQKLVSFLETASDPGSSFLHALDGLSDQYWKRRIDGYTHQKAYRAVANLELDLPRQEEDDDNEWLLTPRSTSQHSARADRPGETPPLRVLEARCLTKHRSCTLPSAFDVNNYTLTRLSGLSEDTVGQLNQHLGSIMETPSFKLLGDNNWEIITLRSHLPILEFMFSLKLPNAQLDLNYDPTLPTSADLSRWDYATASELRKSCFLRRALWIIRQPYQYSPTASCYAHFLSLYGLAGSTAENKLFGTDEQSANPSYQGFVQTEADAFFLVESCIRGDTQYSCRGPQRREVITGSNTFVLDVSTFNTWSDCMKWSSYIQDKGETCVSSDGAGLVEKIFRIQACGVTHYVVSYTEQGQGEGVPRSIYARMPKDLLEYILTLKSAADVPVAEQVPARVDSRTIRRGPVQFRIYFPPFHSDCTLVCAFIPGGMCRAVFIYPDKANSHRRG